MDSQNLICNLSGGLSFFYLSLLNYNVEIQCTHIIKCPDLHFMLYFIKVKILTPDLLPQNLQNLKIMLK